MPVLGSLARLARRSTSSVRRHPWWLAACVGVLVALGLGGALLGRKRATVRLHFPPDVPSSGEGFALALYQSVGARLDDGHTAALIANGAIFDALAEAIRGARSSVNVDVYIWQRGRASDLLLGAIEARRPEVACRVVADDLGSPDFERDIAPRLRAARCEARLFRPVAKTTQVLARNHRKLVVVDGEVAFTGGFGIKDEWLGDGVTAEGWRDTSVRFTGPAVLSAQQAVAENWQEAGGALLPPEAFPGFAPRPIALGLVAGAADAGASDADAADAGPLSSSPRVHAALVTSSGAPSIARADRLVQLLVHVAKRRLWIANAYFAPSSAVLEAIQESARRGVDVRLLVPGKKSDSNLSVGSQHVAYDDLVGAGVKAFEYEPSMMHAKTLVVDDEVGVVGSINLDPLSSGELEEDALVVQDQAFAAELAKAFEADCDHARPVPR